MLKKIFSSIVAVSFLVNTVSYADVLALKTQSNLSSNTMAPQSRLNPVSNPEMLDIMKLTAEITDLASKPDITDIMSYNEREYREIDAIGEETAFLKGVAREGDKLVLNFKKNPWCPSWIVRYSGPIIGLQAMMYFLSIKHFLPVILVIAFLCGFLFFMDAS